MKNTHSNFEYPHGSRPSLKVIGSFHPSTAFALKPRYEAGTSITFKMNMWIPSIIWFGLAIGPAVGIGIDYQMRPQTYTNPSALFTVIASLSGFFILCGLYTIRLWRSVRIEESGQVHLNTPRIIGRRRLSIEPGSAWADQVTRIRSGKKGIHLLSISRNITEKLRNSDPLQTGTPAFVIHDNSQCFLLVHKQTETIERYKNLLANDYNLKPSGKQYTIQYSGLIDEGWV